MSDTNVIDECLSKLKVIQKIYTWKIQDFHNWPQTSSPGIPAHLSSPKFTIVTADEDVSCMICLSYSPIYHHFTQVYHDKIDMLIKLQRETLNNRSLNVLVKIFLYDNHGEVCKKFEKWTLVEYKKCQNLNWTNFTSRSEILSEKSKLLLLDTLTIRCELAIPSGVENILRKINNPRCSHEVGGKVLSDLKQLFKSEKLSDLTVTSSCGRKFHVHKNILSARSIVFAAMFENDMLESSQNIVKVSDIDGQTMYDLLHWMYTGEIESLSASNAIEIIHAADKYALEDLKLLCENVMCETVTMDNAVEMMIVANLHNAIYLKKECLNIIDKNMEKIMKTSGFQKMVSNGDPNFLEIFRELQKCDMNQDSTN